MAPGAWGAESGWGHAHLLLFPPMPSFLLSPHHYPIGVLLHSPQGALVLLWALKMFLVGLLLPQEAWKYWTPAPICARPLLGVGGQNWRRADVGRSGFPLSVSLLSTHSTLLFPIPSLTLLGSFSSGVLGVLVLLCALRNGSVVLPLQAWKPCASVQVFAQTAVGWTVRMGGIEERTEGGARED